MQLGFWFGEIDYFKTGKNENMVFVTVKYEKTKEKKIFSAWGEIWNAEQTGNVCSGQCLDTIAEYVKDPVFLEIYRLWKLYRHNDICVPEKDEAIIYGLLMNHF